MDNHTHSSVSKHPLRKSNVGEFDCVKELEKMHSNRGTMSRHRQIQLMLQEFSIKKNLLKANNQTRGLSLPVIHGCAPGSHQHTISTIDQSSAIVKANGIVPATQHESSFSMITLPSHQTHTRAQTQLYKVDKSIQRRGISESKEHLQNQVLNDGVRIFATSKENLAIIDEPSSSTLKTIKDHKSVLGRQKYSEGICQHQKRSHTSINVGQNIYKPRISETINTNEMKTPGTSAVQLLRPFKSGNAPKTSSLQRKPNTSVQYATQMNEKTRMMTMGGESITDRENTSISLERQIQQQQPQTSTMTKTPSSVNNQEFMMRSSSQFKHLINQIQQDHQNLLFKVGSPLLETSSTIESKFDTPGPGSYNIKGYFYKKDRNSTSMTNRFKLQNKNTQNNFLSSTENTVVTDRTLGGAGDLNNTLNISQVNALTDFANSQMITNRDSNFGLSFKKSKQIYFKEYEIELFGKESPGPAVYSPNVTFFKKEKHDAKSFTMQKRECPLVPKEEMLKMDLSPMSYNLQNKYTAFEKLKSNIKYFGTKAKRRIDIRMFAQGHADSIKIGWH